MADYNIPQGGGPTDGPYGEPSTDESGFASLSMLRRQYYDYLYVKMPEVEEWKESGRYYHGAQWTPQEIRQLKRRKQPVITSNRIVRKIDAVVGLVERLKQDPKAYPRTPKQESGAEVATAVLRYALDHADWNSKAPRAARFAAITGIGGVELDLAYGDHGDPDIDLHLVYTDTFFYDPRSYDDGFTDCRFMGISKWVDLEQAKEIVPGKEREIDQAIDTGTDLTVNSDRELKWVNSTAKKLRMVDQWYILNGKWCWALYVGNTKLMEGDSPYIDERGKSFCKFLMFSCSVDHDGDRYGFVRNLRGPQDEINHRRSKSLHILNSKRIIADKGAVDDVERARVEWARPDGWLELNPGKKALPDEQQPDFAGQLQMLQESKAEIENFGPNPALIGQGIENQSGRAISLLQQAGIAELGPYILAYRTWKLRVYRAIWNILQRFWTAERWIRVTDDDGLAQFIQLNGLTTDQWGQPAIANYIGSLDVDIIIDEGPDYVNMMADSYDTLLALVRGGQQIPPQILIELSPLQNSVKQKLLTIMQQAQQPDPMKQQAQQIALAQEAARTQEIQSKTFKNQMDAAKTAHQAHIDNAQLALDAQQAQQMGMGQPPSSPNGTPMPAPGPATMPPRQFGPVPGVQSGLTGGVPPIGQQPLPFPGGIPPGALSR